MENGGKETPHFNNIGAAILGHKAREPEVNPKENKSTLVHTVSW